MQPAQHDRLVRCRSCQCDSRRILVVGAAAEAVAGEVEDQVLDELGRLEHRLERVAQALDGDRGPVGVVDEVGPITGGGGPRGHRPCGGPGPGQALQPLGLPHGNGEEHLLSGQQVASRRGSLLPAISAVGDRPVQHRAERGG
jgi:hypothetical protein